MTGTNCDQFTHNQCRSYLNHIVHGTFKNKCYHQKTNTRITEQPILIQKFQILIIFYITIVEYWYILKLRTKAHKLLSNRMHKTANQNVNFLSSEIYIRLYTYTCYSYVFLYLMSETCSSITDSNKILLCSTVIYTYFWNK